MCHYASDKVVQILAENAAIMRLAAGLRPDPQWEVTALPQNS